MKLEVREDPALEDLEVTIACPQVDSRVRRIVSAAELEERKLIGILDGYARVLDADEVLYAETVDGATFLYTADAVLRACATLADLEDHLKNTEFIRATRQMIVNLAHVQGLKPYLSARLELLMDNGERIVASRQFAPIIKERIGLKERTRK